MGLPAAFGVSAPGIGSREDEANGIVQGAFNAVGPSQPFAFMGPVNLAIWGSEIGALTTTAGTLAATTPAGVLGAPGMAVNSMNVPRGTTFGSWAAGAGNLVLPAITLYGRVNPAAAHLTDLQSTTGLVGAVVNGFGVSNLTVAEILQAAIPGNRNIGTRPGIVRLSAKPSAMPFENDPTPYIFQLGTAAIIAGTDNAAQFTGASVVYAGSVQLERSFDGGATWIVCNIGGSGQLAVWAAGTPVSLVFGEPERGVLYRFNCTATTGAVPINYRMSTTGAAATVLNLASNV